MLNSANKITQTDNSSIRAYLEFIKLANTFPVPSYTRNYALTINVTHADVLTKLEVKNNYYCSSIL